MRLAYLRFVPRVAGRAAAARVARTLLPVAAALSPSAGAAQHHTGGPPARVPAGSVAEREQTADQQVRHALNRLAFGARAGDVPRVRAMGVDRWIDAQLHPERLDDRALEATLAGFATLGRSGAALLRDHPPSGLLARQAAARRRGTAAAAAPLRAPARTSPDDAVRRRRAARQSYRVVGELQSARVARAVGSERQLQEVMVDFWANHFSVFAGKGRVRYFLPEYEATLRRHALGRFRELLGAVAKSSAMLQYLDNAQSVADSTRPTASRRAGLRRPGRRARGTNENYARELLELHTLGVDGGYTQQDVGEVARAFTGWTVRPPVLGGGFAFHPAAHDAGAKTILGRRLPAGRGVEDGEAALDLVARHPSAARFIAHKLAVRFVSDSPPPALVARAAETFRRTDGDIRATLATILHSPEFFSRAAFRAKVKTPFELVASAARALGASPDTTPRTARVIARLGQPIFGRQSPDGWPETGSAWMNAGAILNRINFGMAVAANRLPGAQLDAWPAARTLRAAPREAQVDGVVAAFLGGEASPDTRAILKGGENPLLAAARARGAGADAAPRDGAAPPLDPFAKLVGLALGAPEFQRR